MEVLARDVASDCYICHKRVDTAFVDQCSCSRENLVHRFCYMMWAKDTVEANETSTSPRCVMCGDDVVVKADRPMLTFLMFNNTLLAGFVLTALAWWKFESYENEEDAQRIEPYIRGFNPRSVVGHSVRVAVVPPDQRRRQRARSPARVG
jgi:hypothetical protein